MLQPGCSSLAIVCCLTDEKEIRILVIFDESGTLLPVPLPRVFKLQRTACGDKYLPSFPRCVCASDERNSPQCPVSTVEES